jgi:hypothetical protein
MPPRRERQSPDPEDREVRRRGRPSRKSRNGETDERSLSETRGYGNNARDAQLVLEILVTPTTK